MEGLNRMFVEQWGRFSIKSALFESRFLRSGEFDVSYARICLKSIISSRSF